MRTLLNLRMRLAQSGLKPSDTFKCAIYGVQTTWQACRGSARQVLGHSEANRDE